VQALASKAGSYYWTFFQVFGRECYRTWRQDFFVSFITALAVYAITYRSDPAALESLKVALQSAGVVLGLFTIFHLVKTPYLVHTESGEKSLQQTHWSFGVAGVFVLGALAFGCYTAVTKVFSKRPAQVVHDIQPEIKAIPKEENSLTKNGPVRHAPKPQIDPTKRITPSLQPSVPTPPNIVPSQENASPTQIDRVADITKRMPQADRERLSQALFEFSKLLDQANELWGKVNLEGGTLSHSWGGELNNETAVDAHINKLRELKGMANDFLKSFRSLQGKWGYYEVQINYIFGDAAENNGPNALINALDDYLQYLESWKTVANKGGRNMTMYQDTQNMYDTYVHNFALWKQACDRRLQQIRNSLQ
jgi:hypothetical protein